MIRHSKIGGLSRIRVELGKIHPPPTAQYAQILLLNVIQKEVLMEMIALFCEGDCQAWVHSGLNKQAYEALTEENSPYLCPL